MDTGPCFSPRVAAAWKRGLEVLQPSASELARGLELHRELSVCDGYGFLPRVYTPAFCARADARLDRGAGKAEWTRHYWSGLMASPTYEPEGAAEFRDALAWANLGAMVQPVNDIGECLQDAVTLLSGYRHLCHVFSDRLFQATCAGDLERPRTGGRTGVVFSLTGLPLFGGGSMADPDALLDWVEVWYRLGVRFTHLGYNRRNGFADGCTEANDGGVSDFGAALIARMNREGIVVDVPHSGPRATLDATRLSGKPVVATHTGCAALYDHPRCKSDAALKALADTGGYAGIFAIPNLLGKGADLNLLLAHVRHAVRLVGAEHVAIGTDNSYISPPEQRTMRSPAGRAIFDRSGWKPEHKRYSSLEHETGSLAWTNWPLITVGLLKIGLGEEEIGNILGGNLRRVLDACRPEGEAAASRVGRGLKSLA
ncbi:MAG TPA: membrane dipeptidase [Chthoniobacteraceae bacterium]|nr:membrane dipeptidase [Chthoniobacteraceae bacterium]